MRKLYKERKLLKGGNYMRKYGKLFTVLGGKFKFSAQDSDLKYLCWQWKSSPVSLPNQLLTVYNYTMPTIQK